MANVVEDPVCGMQVNPEHAPARAVYQDTTYYFCSTVCKQLFEHEPQDYVETIPEQTTDSE